MLNKKKVAGAVLSLGILGCVGMSASPVALAAPVQIEQFKDVLDFKGDFASGQEWANKHLHQFFDLSNQYEQNLMNYYSATGDLINAYLRDGTTFEKDGKLSDEFYTHPDFWKMWHKGPDLNEYKNAQYYRDFDQLFQKEGAKLSNSMVVYRRVDGNEFMKGLTLDVLTESEFDQKSIDKTAFDKFKKSFEHKRITNMGYTSTSIYRDPGNFFSRRPILIELTVPKGASAIYVQNHAAELLLPRNASYQIDEIYSFKESVMNSNREDGVKVKAHLVVN